MYTNTNVTLLKFKVFRWQWVVLPVEINAAESFMKTIRRHRIIADPFTNEAFFTVLFIVWTKIANSATRRIRWFLCTQKDDAMHFFASHIHYAVLRCASWLQGKRVLSAVAENARQVQGSIFVIGQQLPLIRLIKLECAGSKPCNAKRCTNIQMEGEYD